MAIKGISAFLEDRTAYTPPPPRPHLLHTSIKHHLSTEVELLQALWNRSKHQHRSQLFLRRLRGVLRLGRLVQSLLLDAKGIARLSRLIPKFVTALIAASNSTSQVVELHYFLPLHTLLIGIYARLFATASNIAGSLNLDMGYILAGRSSSRPRRPQKRRIEKQRSEPTDGVATEMIVGGMEIGTKIARPLIVVDPVPVPSSSPVIVASSSAGDDVEIVPSVEESGIPHDLNPHNPEPAQCTHANDDINRENRPQPEAAKPSRPGRKRRTDEMDDIFGF